MKKNTKIEDQLTHKIIRYAMRDESAISPFP
jgi:hypothetical protein